MKRGELLAALDSHGLDSKLERVYGAETGAAVERVKALAEAYADTFPSQDSDDVWLFSAPGRTELVGNHTDHQHGHCLAASVNLDTIAYVTPTDGEMIRIKSRHHRIAEVDKDDRAIHPEEVGTSAALVRGLVACLTGMGYPVSGFQAYTTTRVLRGSGLSSSAAFEVLVTTMMNHLFCKGALPPLQIARISQYAENVYFQKPCGLMDQLACSMGGAVVMDFHNIDAPTVRKIPLDPTARGYALCIIDSRASHADLIADYAAIPQEMQEVASCFGREVLADVAPGKVVKNLSLVRATCGDRAALRAYHFFKEDIRVLQACEALEKDDFDAYLRCVRASGRSSCMYLQNVASYRESRSQPVAVLLAVAEDLLGEQGAVRVHGGGFAGTIQAYVPLSGLESFIKGMETVVGQGACQVVTVRNSGAVLLAH